MTTTKQIKSMSEYRKLTRERNEIISQNRSRLVKNRKLRFEGKAELPIQTVPEKPEYPKALIAYDAEGTYQGRLLTAADVAFAKEQGYTIKEEDAAY